MTTMLEAELLAHLDAQIASAKRLLATILEQGAAIRERDVEAVLGKLAEIQTEMGRRGRLEQDRTGLLQRAGHAIGVGAAEVTLERMCALITPEAARQADARSAELRGLLAEIAREHGINRALMRQELSFLAHLTRLVGGETQPAYMPGAAAPAAHQGGAPAAYRVLDMKA